MSEESTRAEPDEVLLRLDQIAHDANRARRAAETTRTIAIVLIVLFVVLPAVLMALSFVTGAADRLP